jgi:hypothetical protein
LPLSKVDAIFISTSPFVLTQYIPTDSCLDPVPVMSVLSARCLLQMVVSSRLLPPPIDIDVALYLHKPTSHHEQ